MVGKEDTIAKRQREAAAGLRARSMVGKEDTIAKRQREAAAGLRARSMVGKEDTIAKRQREAAVGLRADGAGPAAVTWIGRVLSRKYLSGSAHDSGGVWRAQGRRPPAEQPQGG